MTPGVAVDAGVVEKTLVYEALVDIVATGMPAREISGSSEYSSLSISIAYRIEEHVNMTLLELQPVSCIVEIKVLSVSASPASLTSILGNVSSQGNLRLEGEDCFNPPLILSFRSGEATLEKPLRNGTVIGVVRLDVDAIHMVGGNPFPSMDQTNHTSFWSIYYEPLTTALVYYTYTYSEKSPYGGSYFYSVTLSLINYRDAFGDLVSRSVMELRFLNSTVNPSIIVVYPSLVALKGSHEGSMYTISFNESTRCFILVGPFDSSVNFTSSISMLKYTSLNGLTVYYSVQKEPCDTIWFNITAPISNGKDVPGSEKGVPPSYSPPSIDAVVFTILVVSIILYTIYSVISWLVGRYHGLIRGGQTSGYTYIPPRGSFPPYTSLPPGISPWISSSRNCRACTSYRYPLHQICALFDT